MLKKKSHLVAASIQTPLGCGFYLTANKRVQQHSSSSLTSFNNPEAVRTSAADSPHQAPCLAHICMFPPTTQLPWRRRRQRWWPGGYSSLSMFIESCEVQLSSAIVVSMLQYLIRSLQKHAQNMSIQLIHRVKKKKHLQSLFFFFNVEF